MRQPRQRQPPQTGTGSRHEPTNRPGEEDGGAVFTGFMINTWATATIVAIVAGVVGYFVVLRGAAFPAHAIPKGAFAGAAGASLLGINTLTGLGVFPLLGALAIGTLGLRGRQDVV